MSNETEFYLVYTPKGNNPIHRHSYYYQASNEAVRLALANPGTPFCVAHVGNKFESPAVVHTVLDKDVPF